MTRLSLIGCVCITGCAVFAPPPPAAQRAPLGPAEIISAQAAQNVIAIGKSAKADVAAALGQAIVIDFDSGYEVWVYREQIRDKTPPPRTEFVLLFAPSGILAKTRIR